MSVIAASEDLGFAHSIHGDVQGHAAFTAYSVTMPLAADPTATDGRSKPQRHVSLWKLFS